MKNIDKFLNFNGKRISVLAADGQWWIAIRPICEALSIDYKAQHKAILRDEILSQLSSEQTTVAADNRLRKMVCLPEKYIYGWLFSIRSDSEDLKRYKRECYDVLFNHFNKRNAAVLEKMAIEEEMQQLRDKADENDTLDTYLKLEKRKNKIVNSMRKMDKKLVSGQMTIEFN